MSAVRPFMTLDEFITTFPMMNYSSRVIEVIIDPGASQIVIVTADNTHVTVDTTLLHADEQ